MTDKKDGPSKGPERAASDGSGARRPFATIDLKATEVKGAQQGGKGDMAEAAAAAKVAAAAAETSAAKASPPGAAAAGSVPAAGGGKSDKPANEDKSGGASDKVSMPGQQKGKGVDGGAAATVAAVTASTPRSGGGIGRFISHAAAGVLGGVLAMVGAPHVGPLLGLGDMPGAQAPAPTASPEILGRLTALERTMRERLTQAAVATPQADPAQRQALEAAQARIDEVTAQVASLREAHKQFVAETVATVTEMRTAQRPASDPGERLTRLEEQIAQMAAAAAADPQRAGRLPQLAQLTGKIADLETQLANRLDRLQKDVRAEVEARVTAAAEASEAAKAGAQRIDREVVGVKSDATRLATRVDQVKAGSDKLEEQLKALQQVAETLRTTLEGFRAEVEKELKVVARPADVARAVTPVSDRLAALEGGMQGIVKAEEDRRTNAERIVLSLELGNLRRAMDRGATYAAELAEVRRIAGNRLDLGPLEKHQTTGVPTVAELGRQFRAVANAVLDVDATPENAGVVDKLMTGAKSIVRVRRTTHDPGDNSAEAVVSRIEARLKDGQLAEVLAEAKKLTERTARPAQDWLRLVEARQAVDASLVAIDKALKASLAGQPAAGQPAPKGGQR